MYGITGCRLLSLILKPKISKTRVCAQNSFLIKSTSSASHAANESSQTVGEQVTDQKPSDSQHSVKNDLPVFLKVQYKSQPKVIVETFPEIQRHIDSVPPNQDTQPDQSEESVVQFPYKVYSNIAIDDGKNKEIVTTEFRDTKVQEDVIPVKKPVNETVVNWIKYLEEHNVENIKDVFGVQPDLQELREGAWRFNYGSPDPTVRPSKYKCGGCGSVIHCQDVTIPGYIPSEKFKNLPQTTLKKTLCQRCTFFQEHNVALSVNVSKEHYSKVISKIRHKTALVLLLIDLTDFPCSIWPGIVDLIGKKCPIIVVGTKVDLIPKDDDKYLARVKTALTQNLQDLGVYRGNNLLDIHLVSGKTYYGVEALVTKIFQHWSHKGDVFLVGCTNVGKSTLFNALLQSDLCNIKAVDLIQRATTSVWPGTTLNLLKFPIRKMSGLSMVHRNQRLGEIARAMREENLLRASMFRTTKDPKYATLMGRIEVTNKDYTYLKDIANPPTFCNPDDRKFAGSHFCYDTPGAVYTDQILDLLTVEELTKTLPKETIVPRIFSVRGQRTLFIAGLARIDIQHVQNLFNVYVTVFASHHLPIYIVPTEKADQFYSQHFGTLLKVPFGSPERLECFPKLKPHQFQCTGTHFDESCIDVVLSSIGWVSLTVRREELCQFLAYTPEGRGCYLRQPPLLPLAVRLRSKIIRTVPDHLRKNSSIILCG